jgi:hypothetical protein
MSAEMKASCQLIPFVGFSSRFPPNLSRNNNAFNSEKNIQSILEITSIASHIKNNKTI